MKIRLATLVVAAFLTIMSTGVFAQERYVIPVDEGPQDKSFLAFRNSLVSALKRKDKKYLIGILDKNISVSFGGDDGIEDFKTYWKLSGSKSEVWDELLKVVQNGGKFLNESGEKEFCAPFSFLNFPEDIDSFEYNVIFGDNVRLRERPDLKSRISTQLSYNIVKIDWEKSVREGKSDESPFIWYKIETLGGLKGFVSAEFVRSPIDYRACFTKKNGKWKMTAFVAGD
jgi:hypothetical protein